MEKKRNSPAKITSISQLHQMMQLPKPLHPLISLVSNTTLDLDPELLNASYLFDFYKVSYKYATNGKMGYGQGYYDFNEGGMMFTAPNQLITIEESGTSKYCGFTLFIHPDFIRNYPLGKNIKKYGFFSYDTNEALHLSEKEKNLITGIFDNIQNELETTIDEMSQDVIVSYLEVLLNYSNRFYKRQFITRKTVNSDLLSRLEEVLNTYFNDEKGLNNGLPSVEYLAGQLRVSPRYLSDMLRTLTGQNAQQLIHEKLIEKAKDYLIASNLSVSEIAYQLGFEHSQSFSKLFKSKTNFTPVEFKNSMN
ncbi:MAG: adaA 1 [Bacteroidetes bacterium]|nr:adaA 1 [Bacteroidota bacterium]